MFVCDLPNTQLLPKGDNFGNLLAPLQTGGMMAAIGGAHRKLHPLWASNMSARTQTNKLLSCFFLFSFLTRLLQSFVHRLPV